MKVSGAFNTPKLKFDSLFASCSTIFQTHPLDNNSLKKSMMTKSSKCALILSNSLNLIISRHFYDRRMGSDVDGEVLGAEFKGYTLRITGGNDKQGFTMKQGILVNGRVKILMKQSKSPPTTFLGHQKTLHLVCSVLRCATVYKSIKTVN